MFFLIFVSNEQILNKLSAKEQFARRQFVRIDGCDDTVLCVSCNVAIWTRTTNDTCFQHQQLTLHKINMNPDPAVKKVSFVPEKLQGLDDKIIPLFGEENKTGFRMFCIHCRVPIFGRKSTIQTHMKSNGHQESTGQIEKKLSAMDEILSKNLDILSRCEDHQEDIFCSVCAERYTRATTTFIAGHLSCKKHLGILNESSEPDTNTSSFVSNDRFGLQREKYKGRSMIKIASHFPAIDVKFNPDVKMFKFYCNVCNKFILGRGNHTASRHVESQNHLRYERDSDGVMLDDFLYEFFTWLVKGKTH